MFTQTSTTQTPSAPSTPDPKQPGFWNKVKQQIPQSV